MLPLAVAVIAALVIVALGAAVWGVRSNLFGSSLKPASGQVLPATLAEAVRDYTMDVPDSDTEQEAVYLMPGPDENRVYLRVATDVYDGSMTVKDQAELGNAAHTEEFGDIVCFEVFDDVAGYCARDLDGGRLDISGDDVSTYDLVRLLDVAYSRLHD